MTLWDLAPYLLFLIKLTLSVVSVVFLISGVDDCFIDACFLLRACYRRLFVTPRFPKLTREALLASRQQQIAIMIPAWHESEVIRRMLDRLVRTLEYDRYHVFVGVYPNDADTQREVRAAAQTTDRIHCVVCPQDGPTCKADCLNWVYRAVRASEHGSDHRFDIFVMQDSEDCPHPLSLRLFNYLIPRKDLVQLPVVPLPMRWLDFTAGHYMDEFAESHSKNMIVREALSGTIPSAGVGTGFSRRALELLAREHQGQVFNAGSLTEDYEMGFRLRRNDLKEIFVRQALPDPIVVRAYFPNTFRAAVKQKSRWVLGITLQGWRNIGWTGNMWTDYMLFRDRKSLITSLANVLGYIAFFPVVGLWMLGTASIDAYRFPPLVREGSWLYWVILIDTVFLAVRIVARAVSVYCCYDLKQAMLSVPRQVWGNFINFGAAIRALNLFAVHAVTGEPIAWGKTDHTFPSEAEMPVIGSLLTRP